MQEEQQAVERVAASGRLLAGRTRKDDEERAADEGGREGGASAVPVRGQVGSRFLVPLSRRGAGGQGKMKTFFPL